MTPTDAASPSPDSLTAWRRAASQPFAGWDFSYLDGRMIESAPPWSYGDWVRRIATDRTSVLDMGTGGGERLLELRDALPATVIATEGYRPNVRLARDSLAHAGVAVIVAEASTRSRLPFADGSFDCVINRHAGFACAEVSRVLVPGGVFVTQQVGGQNAADLVAAMGGEPLWPDASLATALRWLRAAGDLEVVAAEEDFGTITFTDVSAIVYLLAHVPWIVPGFGVDRHARQLRRLQHRLRREGRLVFRAHKFLLCARKMELAASLPR